MRSLSTAQRILMESLRMGTGLCILADAWWYLWSHKVRKAYMKELGLPTQLVYVAAIVYCYFGTRIVLNYRTRASSTAMIITYGIVAYIVHHPVGAGGIGEYPRNINTEVNLLNILKYAAVIGGLFQISGYDDFKRRDCIMEGTQSYAIVLGRAIIGIHYLLESGWFRIYQHDLRTTQIKIQGGNPIIEVWIVGVIYFIGGLNLWFGGATRRRMGALLLATLTAILTVLEGEKIATSLGIYHMTPQAKFHHVIINIQIILGCIMTSIIGGHDVIAYEKKEE